MYKGASNLRIEYYINCLVVSFSKGPSQPQLLSMRSKLGILHREAKSYCFTVSRVPESMFLHLY